MKNWFPALTSRKFQAFMICLVILAIVIFPQTSYAWVDFGCRTAIFDLNCGIGELLYNLAAAFAFICGNILDLVVRFFVFEMTTTLETGNLFALQEGDIPTYRFVWFIVRDLANLSFIFILIYAALATIFQIQSVNIRRVIPQLILVAILMNFSLFFVQVATDFSNYLSYQFFTAVEINVAPDTDDGSPVGLGSTGSTTAQIGQSQQQGLSNIIMNVTRITALIGTPEAGSVDNLASSGSAQNPGIAFGVFASIFTIIGALVMLAGAMLLFIRFFMIVIYMIASPIAFAASITQGGKDKITKNWWLKGLTAQLAFAPAYFGLLYLSLIFLSAMTGEGAFNPSGNDGILAYWVRNAMIFIVSSAFLIFALIASKRIGAVGGNFALRMTKQGAGAIIGGGSAWAMRKTLGAGASRLSSGDRERYLQNKIAKGGVGGQVARMQLKTLKNLSDANFDSRNVAKYVPGVAPEDFKFIGEGDLNRGYQTRRGEKIKKKKEDEDEMLKHLDDDAKMFYAVKKRTTKDGLLGVLQNLAYSRNQSGAATPRSITERFLQSKFVDDWDGIKNGASITWGNIRESAGLDREGGKIYYPKQKKLKRIKELQNLGVRNESQQAEFENLIGTDRIRDLENISDRSEYEQKLLDSLTKKRTKLIDEAAEYDERKVFYEKKRTKLNSNQQEVLLDTYDSDGVVGLTEKINSLIPDSVPNHKQLRAEMLRQFDQLREDELGSDRKKILDEEYEAIRKAIEDAAKALEKVERDLSTTNRDLSKNKPKFEDFKALQVLKAIETRDAEQERRYNELMAKEQELVEAAATTERLQSIKAAQEARLTEARAELLKKETKGRKEVRRLRTAEINIMNRFVSVDGGPINSELVDYTLSERARLRDKKQQKQSINYEKLAEAVESGVDRSSAGGDIDRDFGATSL